MPSISTLAKVVPFALFIALMMLQSFVEWIAPQYFETFRWLSYPLRVTLTAAALMYFWLICRQYKPSLQGLSSHSILLAVVIGVGVLLFWIYIGPMFRMGTPSKLNPIPQDPVLGPLWLALRFIGAVIIVPIIEELFWRSYLARRLDTVEVDKTNPQTLTWRAMISTSIVFGLAHAEVVAGVVAGVAFCLLYKHKGDLREAMLGHAITNALLFFYVVKFSAFEFWG